MSQSAAAAARALHGAGDRLPAWAVVLAGFAAMYAPVYWWAAQSIWASDDHAHGPVILLVAAWLLWRQRGTLASLPSEAAALPGWCSFGAGLLVYVLGRALDFSILLFASQLLVLAGVLLLMKGWAGLRAAWFPVIYLVFMIPLPSALVDAVTGPLKEWVSVIGENLLYGVGYPVARSGVIISIGQYQLLVADACSGLHSMFSLAAVGTLFVYLTQPASGVRNALMLVAIPPIAFAVNIIRVVLLMLVTYHFGDEAAQGFAHGAIGLVLMGVALALFFAFDAVVGALMRAGGHRPRSDRGASSPASRDD